MNKAELIAAVAEKNGMTKKDAEKVVLSVFETITDTLAAGEKVQIVGFGTFEAKKREPRVGRNPKTNETIELPASVAPAFKAGKSLKEALAK